MNKFEFEQWFREKKIQRCIDFSSTFFFCSLVSNFIQLYKAFTQHRFVLFVHENLYFIVQFVSYTFVLIVHTSFQ